AGHRWRVESESLPPREVPPPSSTHRPAPFPPGHNRPSISNSARASIEPSRDSACLPVLRRTAGPLLQTVRSDTKSILCSIERTVRADFWETVRATCDTLSLPPQNVFRRTDERPIRIELPLHEGFHHLRPVLR